MNNIQNYGMTNYQSKTNATNVMFKANAKPIEDAIVGYLHKNSARIDADAKRLEMQGRALLEKNLPSQLTLEGYRTARVFPFRDYHISLFRQIANCFRYGNRNHVPLSEEVVSKVQEFMSKSGKNIAKEDIHHVATGSIDRGGYIMHLPVYFDKESQITTVFTTKGDPQCKMKFISGGMKNGIMKDFKVTEVYVPEKGTFVKTESMYSPLDEVCNPRTLDYEKGTEPFFNVEDLLK